MSAINILDDEQRAAYEADHNVVVSAGAGSGKTTVLSHRYVRLVRDKRLPVDSILTLTFTRKAAAEMFSRIYQELSKIDEPWVQEQLRRFDSARIDTLDSFCASIVRGSCQNYGIPPNFTIDEARLQVLAEQTAMEFLMEHRSEPVIASLVAHYSFERIVKEFLADFCLYRLPFVANGSYKESAKKQVDEILKLIKNILKNLKESILSGAALDTSSGQIHLTALVKTAQKYEDISFEYNEAQYHIYLNLCSDFLGIRLPGKVAEGTDSGTAKKILKEIKPLCERLKNLLIFYQQRSFIEVAGTLLDDLAERYIRNKRREALLSFGDLVDLAVDILKTSLPLRTYYKNQIQAIMIDEFQDNNEKQKELLYLLAEDPAKTSPGIPEPEDLAPDKLFFVGDEKQSIYRFRGADVSVFKKLSAELSRSPLPRVLSGGKAQKETNPFPRQLPISTNYRSEPELVDFFNSLFPAVFGSAEEDYEAFYTPAHPSPQRKGSGKAAVELYLNQNASDDDAEDDAGDSEPIADAPPAADTIPVSAATNGTTEEALCTSAETEAITAAERIIQGIADGDFTFGDLAILFRTTTHQSVYEQVFRTVGIPFVSADPRGLFLDGPANDIYALLRLVIYPEDSNAYATVLRSPFVNLSDHCFLKLLLETEPTSPAFGSPFQGLLDSFWEDCETWDKKRYSLGADLYQQVRSMADTKGIADIVAWLWYDSGYRISILADSDMAATAGHFRLLYDLAVKADQRHLTLSAFLDELTPLMGSSEKIEGDEGASKANAVTFMTIHKSKGLQFPVIIIPQIGAPIQPIKNDKPYFYSPIFGPVISWSSYSKNNKDKIANPLFEDLRESEKLEQLAELKRLLYVAMTRAERKCILLGSTKRSKNSFYDLIQSGLENVSPHLYYRRAIESVPLKERNQRLNSLRQRLASLKQTDSANETNDYTNIEAFYSRTAIAPISAAGRTTSPTLMERTYQEYQACQGIQEHTETIELSGLSVDPIIAQSGKDLETLFGTLCHWIIQKEIEGENTELPLHIKAAMKDAGLTSQQEAAFLETAKILANQFIQSDVGKQALQAKPNLRTEYSFILPLWPQEKQGTSETTAPAKPILVKGSMDLIFETSTDCLIIDFKTDKTLQSEAHRIQMECYRRAGQAFSDKPAKTFLVYLRGMRIIEMKPAMDDTLLYQIAAESLAASEAIEESPDAI
ncbi:exodeoxyribonuclease V subunit beta [Gracilinema caldarium]|uniref:UvrD-helicase domain-containing protein n=1 Tax=Gracilinema caldarium TaxID=215591 RepID=UPI0026E96230|nr:UvrD-helicase domain-containing protein [Gracilinema caldarium]